MTKPFSTYPEDRAELLMLARKLQRPLDNEDLERFADRLSSLVIAILLDEEFGEGGEP